MKDMLRIVSAIITFALIISIITFTTAETENSSIEGAWKLIDIEVVHHYANGITMTVNKKSITDQTDISITFKGGNYTLRLKKENNSETYYGTYCLDTKTLTVHAEEEGAFSYYVIGDMLTLINQNQTYTFLREGASAKNVFKGGTLQGIWQLTNIEAKKEAGAQSEEVDSELFSGIVLGLKFGFEASLVFQGDTMAVQFTKSGQDASEAKGTYWTAGTMLHFTINEDNEFFSYTVEGNTLTIGNNKVSLVFTRQ